METSSVVPVQSGIGAPMLMFGIALALVLLIVAIVMLSRLIKLAGQGKAVPAAAPALVSGSWGPNPQVIAAITAALMMCEQTSGKQLVVRSVRRGSAWSDAGKRESINF